MLSIALIVIRESADGFAFSLLLQLMEINVIIIKNAQIFFMVINY